MPGTVLSAQLQRVLEELCAPFGSVQTARNNPEEVLLPLLQDLNETKRSVSAMVIPILERTISDSAIEHRRWLKQRKTKVA